LINIETSRVESITQKLKATGGVCWEINPEHTSMKFVRGGRQLSFQVLK